MARETRFPSLGGVARVAQYWVAGCCQLATDLVGDACANAYRQERIPIGATQGAESRDGVEGVWRLWLDDHHAPGMGGIVCQMILKPSRLRNHPVHKCQVCLLHLALHKEATHGLKSLLISGCDD